MAKYIGKDLSRPDGVAKVTGKAKYAAEFKVPEMAYGFMVMSTIAKGTIKTIETAEAGKAPGVIRVFTHENFPKFTPPAPAGENARPDMSFRALSSDKIHFNLQPIALVLAETFEQARSASRLVTATYTEEKPLTNMEASLDKAVVMGAGSVIPRRVAGPRGNPAEALKNAPVKIESEYITPIDHHNPMEPHGAIAFWEGDKLTIFDKTQGVNMVRQHLATRFSIPPENVNVIAPFVGGAFGASLRPNYYPVLIAAAAREIKRPVKLSYTRTQMFTGHGYRSHTWQRVSLGAEKNGKLTAIIQDSINNSSNYEEWADNLTGFTRTIYACPNVETRQRILKLDMATPAPVRAPGAVVCMFGLECAMDELAYELKIDPMELRLINYAETDPENGKQFSSKALRECYRMGAEKFGWKDRKFEPRSMRDGRLLVGWGMATGTWSAGQGAASVRLVLKADGTAGVASSVTDIGPGTYSLMAVVAAEYLGVPPEQITVELGDTKFPRAGTQGGSTTAASIGTAIYGSANNIKQKLFDLANKDAASIFKSAKAEELELMDGVLRFKNDPAKSVNAGELMRRNGLTEIVDIHEGRPGPERQNYSTAAHGAQFIEVKVDPDLRTIKVTRAIEVTACGKIINPKTSHSQEIGGVVWGIGMALQEKTEVDHRYGRIMNPNLQHYHVPVNGDILNIETIFVEEDDKIVNPLGIKGMGELGMVGIPAAIANAVFHATGKRVRDLPITIDKLI
jgi:xanthine dehydrogenase YagR molybdenum-binding subunit